nr:ABC transporter ATP-binding protein [Plastoroseomonas arctica]
MTRRWRFVAEDALLSGIRKSFNIGAPAEVEILHGIDITLEHGAFCALIGPSGSGKSTLLNIIGLLDRQSAGRLVIGGKDTQGLDDAALTRLRGETIGFVFQAHNLIPAFTAAENVMMPMLLSRGWADAAMRAAAEALLDRVGMTRWRDARVGNLSGGQAQRVSIARALMMKPVLVLADEPTGNLDTAAADGVFDMMHTMNQEQGMTFLIVTHDPRLAKRCGRIIELVDGQVVQGAA